MKTKEQLEKNVNQWIVVFMVFLVLSGITAFPIETELALLKDWTTHSPSFIKNWIEEVYQAVRTTNQKYPFLAYGTDWLAFAHIVIAIAFWGPLKDPVKNIWVIQFGMIACVLIFPLALIAGPIREIPMYWRLIDCSFGLFGFIPLYICYRKIKTLEKLNTNK